MKPSVIINSVLSVCALVVVVLVLLQTGIGGVSLQPSSWFGIYPKTPLEARTYLTCKNAQNPLALTNPRSCTQEGVTYYENYALRDKTQYITDLENEAAQNGQLLASPVSQNLNKANVTESQPNSLYYGAIYTTKKDSDILTMIQSHKNLKNQTDSQKKSWSDLIGVTNLSEANKLLGGNTAFYKTIDLKDRNITSSWFAVDGGGDKLFAPYNVIVVGQVRDNWILLSRPFVLANLNTLISTCISSPEVTAQTDKESAAQTCLNKTISTNTNLLNLAETQAKELAQVFAF